ncbi:hypothetical protein P4S60_00170 [Pseudoalteromonas sp. Hal040]|uniref:ABC-three component system protein n=1 Tax=unclassified Pseudoalteromonas TaxID=194690 RepID=UPI00301D1858
MSGPRDYTDKTLKRLFGLACNRCSFPDCDEVMSDEYSAKNSNICHIEAAKAGGERWNKNMSNPQRADYDNLILLCVRHHDITNDVETYTVEKLKLMKKKHEQEMELRTSNKRPLNNRPSLLTDIMNKILDGDIDGIEEEPVKNAFSIEDKIAHNKVVTNVSLLENYRVYQGKINALYSELEKSGSPKKEGVLRAIKHIYVVAKGELLGAEQSLVNIQNNADKLIDVVKRKLHERIDESANNDPTIAYDDVEFALSILVVDGFLRCKILEEPKK